MIKRSEWPKPEVILKACIACNICVDACPVGCLVMSDVPRDKGVDAFPYLKDPRGLHRLRVLQQGLPGGRSGDEKTGRRCQNGRRR